MKSSYSVSAAKKCKLQDADRVKIRSECWNYSAKFLSKRTQAKHNITKQRQKCFMTTKMKKKKANGVKRGNMVNFYPLEVSRFFRSCGGGTTSAYWIMISLIQPRTNSRVRCEDLSRWGINELSLSYSSSWKAFRESVWLEKETFVKWGS